MVFRVPVRSKFTNFTGYWVLQGKADDRCSGMGIDAENEQDTLRGESGKGWQVVAV